MRRWFMRLPIHRKLVVMALLVTTVALVIANVGLLAIDAWRYRSTTRYEAVSTARVIAGNTVAAVAFKDPDDARRMLASVRVRPAVRRACLYLSDATLFAAFAREPRFACPPTQPTEATSAVVIGTAPVVSNGRIIGTVYIERDLADLWARIAVAAFTGVVMLLLAGAAALWLAHRLTRAVSTPIAQLAASARAIRPDDDRFVAPPVVAGDDELGDLVRAFSEMLRRVQRANAEREQLLLREREASRLKDEFLATVSHELRTPLNAIVGWVQILTTTAADEETVAKGLATIARNAKAQTRVIDDLVDVSRIVTGKLTLRFDPVDLCDVVDHAVDVMRGAAQSKGVELRTSVPEEVCLVNGDRDRLQQIIWNLLSNAVKFTPAGGHVHVSLRAEDAIFALTVQDTGVGIAPAFLPHVFDRFRQADGSMTREHGGLGLGLAIVKELTELHGGTVRVASGGEAKGASFTIRLPQLAGLHRAHPTPSRGSDRTATLAGIEILAVDDNQDALDVLAAALAAEGARVRTAAGGEESIREFDRAPADVLLCDLAMPGINGFDVLRRVRERDARRGVHTVAIAVTAHASEEHRAASLLGGFDDHLAKPYELSRLVSAIVQARRGASAT